MTQRDDMGRVWDAGSGLGTHVHLWWIHVNVWQNQYNIVKQKNKIIKKKSGEKYWGACCMLPSAGHSGANFDQFPSTEKTQSEGTECQGSKVYLGSV